MPVKRICKLTIDVFLVILYNDRGERIYHGYSRCKWNGRRECLSTVYKYMRELVCSVQNESHMSPCFSFQCYIRRYFVAKK